MSWTLKILAESFKQRDALLTNGFFNKSVVNLKDYVINHHRNEESTWREVEYTLNKRNVEINKQDAEEVFIMNSDSAPYQFINPIYKEIDLILPKNPKHHTKYIIKNTSLTRIINIKTDVSSDPIVVLKTPDNLIKLYFDSVQYQLEI